jgi:hypothetical protein
MSGLPRAAIRITSTWVTTPVSHAIALLRRPPHRADAGRGETGAGARAGWRSPAQSRPDIDRTRWHALALPVQAKLEVGAPGDAYEEEADRVADQVLRMPGPAATDDDELPVEGDGVPAVQRLCSDCEEGLQRRPEGDDEQAAVLQPARAPGVSAPVPSSETEARIHGLPGGGQPLGAAERAFFEPRLGRDLGPIRIHTDPDAAGTATALRAQAYTYGRDLVFAPGRYAPDTHSGRRLLAHELTHSIQQGQGGVVRRYADTRIYGVSPGASAHDHHIFFDYESSRIPPSERAKLGTLGTLYAGKEVKLFGRASEEGDAAFNNTLIARRIAAVRRALERRGVIVYDTEARLADATGKLDYRHQRAVEVVERPPATPDTPAPEASSAEDPCTGPDPALASGADLDACRRAVFSVWPRALTAVAVALARLVSPGPDARRDTVLARIFTGVAPSVVTGHMANLLVQVARVPLVMSCRSSCDADCTRGKINTGTGAGAQLKICPGTYEGTPNRDHDTLGLIHESAHGTPGLAADDIAYGTTRRFEFLPPGESVRNTDSYTYLALLLGDPARTWTIGPAAPDTTPGLDPAAEDPKAREAVAYMEDWLNYADFDTGLTYAYIGRSLGAWSTGVGGDRVGGNAMEELGDDFALSKPSAAAHAVPEDRHRMAAIHDRFDRMYATIHHHPVEIGPADEGKERWDSAAGLPGAGRRLSVPPSFFGLGLKERIKFLIELIARAFRDVSRAFAAKYAAAADAIRTFRGLGP